MAYGSLWDELVMWFVGFAIGCVLVQLWALWVACRPPVDKVAKRQ